ncbi:MAG: hypothetical protein H6R15_3067 [Proteobacteria bacterium]|nr:hypothetical protein [Pseudomonadota bacterium]
MINWNNWQAYDHYGYAIVAIVGTFAAVAVIHRLMSRSPLTPWIRSLSGVVPPFINIIGVLFGLTLAFLANDTWSAHDRAMNAVYKEADGLRSLLVLVNGLDDTWRPQLSERLADYAQNTVAEWPLLGQRRVSEAVDAKGDRILSLLASKQLAEAAGVNVQALMLREATEIRDQRNLRISLSRTHVNPLKWLGMAFLGLLTLLSIAAVHAENARASLVATLLFALSAAPTAAIVLIQGNPFQEPAAVSPVPISAAVAR